ncbi:MAG TPA: VIT domain-containing protein [Natronosporangium sp.]
MSPQLTPMTDREVRALPAHDDAGLGTLRTDRGNLPLVALDLRARITGLLAHTELEQVFHNPFDQPLEATYVFPLPDRAAVTGMRMVAADRTIEAELRERGEARATYDRAIAAGQRASIAEQERPDVFTMRVGNILPGEQVTVTLTLAGRLAYEDGEATFRFPLVVAPRYIPGTPLEGGQVGDGYAVDTDAVPDASRITPPVLLPGFPYPVRLGIEVTLDPGGLPLVDARSSLPVAETPTGWRVTPGQRADRDFVLRLRYGDPVHASHALALAPDPTGDEGTFQLTVLPPGEAAPPRPRDLVLVLDRSGSMRGWKMTAARRAAARIVDTLTSDDRFAVLAFDSVVERPDLGEGLVAATDRHRFRAIEHLASLRARGGTELLAPLREALALLAGADGDRDRVLVLVTDGQVGNEDQLLREAGDGLASVRVHTVGIDQAVNAGFLGRLAAAGGGRCELVESEDRLDEAMDRIHRRIGAPLVTGVSLAPDRLAVRPELTAPARIPDLFPGAPLVVTGRYRGEPAGAITVRGTGPDGRPWQARVEPSTVENPALAAVWARAHLRDLEDRYATAKRDQLAELERQIVATSQRFSVLSRFTAYVAVDTRTVTDGTAPHRVIQPVEPAAGWDMLAAPPAAAAPPPGMTVLAAGTFDGAGPQAAAGAVLRAARGPIQTPPMLRRRKPQPSAGLPGPVRWPVEVFAVEAARLRTAAGAPERERRQLLADLISRLDALLRDRWLMATTDDRLAPLRRLLDELRGEAVLRLTPDQLRHTWQRLQELLDQLTGSPPAPRPKPRRRDFWKRS